MTSSLNFIKIYQLVQKLVGGKHRQWAVRSSALVPPTASTGILRNLAAKQTPPNRVGGGATWEPLLSNKKRASTILTDLLRQQKTQAVSTKKTTRSANFARGTRRGKETRGFSRALEKAFCGFFFSTCCSPAQMSIKIPLFFLELCFGHATRNEPHGPVSPPS
jgi:hypothetical protein